MHFWKPDHISGRDRGLLYQWFPSLIAALQLRKILTKWQTGVAFRNICYLQSNYGKMAVQLIYHINWLSKCTNIKETHLFKYSENFTTKKMKIFR